MGQTTASSDSRPSGAVAFLSTDTLHHRYLLNRMHEAGVAVGPVLFETTHVEPAFAVGPLIEDDEASFERKAFARAVPLEWRLPEPPVTVENVNDRRAATALAAGAPRLGIVFGTRRLEPHVIGRFADGLLNVHRGIAQEYRGLDSEWWAIYHRDWDNLGVTLHRVDARLDTGDVIAQRRLELRRDLRTHHLRYETTRIAADLVLDAVRAWQQGALAGSPQEREGRYYSFMPLVLRRICRERFDRYCAELPA